MEQKHTLCLMDWRSLHQNMDDVICNRKSRKEIAYIAAFGLQKESALPAWFVFNDYWSVTEENNERIQRNLDRVGHIKKVALIHNAQPKDMHCIIVNYGDIVDRCGMEINGKIINVKTESALSAFEDTFLNHMRNNVEPMIMAYQKPSLILL